MHSLSLSLSLSLYLSLYLYLYLSLWLQVEVLVMRALSLGLVRGTIDQVDGVAILTWVQPRVLSREQVGTMAERFKAWTATVDATAAAMEARAPELFVQ